MAQITNNFLKGKMNKDLDARLLQPGEYRNAVNSQVSKSEGANVGALENALGNTIVTANGVPLDFNVITGVDRLKSIGYLTDEINNTLYIFLTNNQKSEYDPLGQNFIISYNALQGNYTILVKGAFLNFSQLNPIYGVNILEGLLFWTDNRNQPRKINVVSAATGGYYKTEDQLSVAKYNPYQAIELWRNNGVIGEYETTMKDVSNKAYPNGGYATGQRANNTVIRITESTLTGNIPIGGTLAYIDSNGVLVPIPGTTISAVSAVDIPTGTRDVTVDINLPTIPNTSVEWIFSYNPYYDNDFSGDSDFLKDKFVRFSYRFQFDDNEYSIFAPFTQPAFIPEQDGYFMYQKDTGSTTTNVEDEEDTYRSTIVNFMENKVTKIGLRIPLPFNKLTLKNDLKVTSIDILYKESDALAVKIVETIPIETIASQSGTANILTYNYNSKKPYKTLPSDEIIRVFDKVPVRAFAQEISANRIIYGNFQTKHTPPASINYNVAVAEKQEFALYTNPTQNTVSKVEYPSSSLKTNRSYQVGVVLSDRFGRQSTVVLSESDTLVLLSNENFTGSTIFSDYITSEIIKKSFPGNALRVLFNNPISPSAPNSTTGWPGIYNGDDASADYNPLGWYSYKIVVKQQEQEYYNVYLPGVMAAYPEDRLLEIGKTSHAVLINDNINKVPRDLNEVGPVQTQFRSSVDLNGRVENMNTTSPSLWNAQYYPTKAGSIVSTIADNNDLFNGEGLADYIPSNEFYSIDSDPLIARISTTKLFGVTEENVTAVVQVTPGGTQPQGIVYFDSVAGINVGDRLSTNTITSPVVVESISDPQTVPNPSIIVSGPTLSLAPSTIVTFFPTSPIKNVQNLAIFETDPVLSELDIFWETTTSGLLTELNAAIIENSSSAASLFGFNSSNFTEAVVPSPTTSIGTGAFQLLDSFGLVLPYPANQISSLQVMDLNGTSRNDEFELVDNLDGTYNVMVTGDATHPYYYYGYSNAAPGSSGDLASIQFLFNFTSTSTAVDGTITTNEFQQSVNLANETPIILDGCPTGVVELDDSGGTAFGVVATMHAVSGTAWDTKKATDLDWNLTQPSNTNYFTWTDTLVLNYNATTDSARKIVIEASPGAIIPNGTYTLKAVAKDAGPAEAACNIEVKIINSTCLRYTGDLPLQENGYPPAFVDITYTNCFGQEVTVSPSIPTESTEYSECSQGPITWSVPSIYQSGYGVIPNTNPPFYSGTFTSSSECTGGGSSPQP